MSDKQLPITFCYFDKAFKTHWTCDNELDSLLECEYIKIFVFKAMQFIEAEGIMGKELNLPGWNYEESETF